MARLNDPPAPVTESVDALKRRFIRQNREIARVNSTQSQRIRNLEIEISRLLAENIALREQAIAAAAEAERWRLASRLGTDVLEFKTKLESKLGEVNALVQELGELPSKATRRSSIRRRKSGFIQDLAASPNEKDWNKRQTVSGGVPGEREGQDGRLPAILEDKYYPRRTLENEELRIMTAVANMENEDTESPDLGPPPVVHFEVAGPIVFDSAKSPKRVSGGIVTAEDEVASLPKTLETRRKRRTSSLLQDMSSLEDDMEGTSQENNGKLTLSSKTSAKRKFDISEMELEKEQGSQNDGFEYSRRSSSTATRPKPSRFAPRPADRTQQDPRETQLLSSQKASQGRTALAPKSTNSPAKRISNTMSEQKYVEEGDGSNKSKPASHQNARLNPLRIVPTEIPQADSQDNDIAYAPKTPAPSLEDVISPPSSATDTIPRSKATEAAISNSLEDVLNGSLGRGSRRAKSAVSYAEPNLRDKMRRPDKKLVGAVEGISKPTHTSDREYGGDVQHEKSVEPGPSASGMRIIRIKTEHQPGEEEQSWKDLPEAGRKEDIASPLKDREKLTAFKPTDIRKKRTLSESEGTGLKSDPSQTATRAEHELDKAVSRLSIYDAPNSSPVSLATEDKSSQGKAQQTVPSKPVVTARPSRRHSVQPASEPSILSSHYSSRAAATAAAAPRPSSAASTRDSSGTGKENINLATSTSKLKRSSSTQTFGQVPTSIPSKTSSIGPGNVERGLGTRRRSMMV